jgi:transposase-like protein
MTKIRKEKSVQITTQKGRAYSVSVRNAALRDYLSGMSRSAVAEKYSLPDSSILSHWKRKFASTIPLSTMKKVVNRRSKRLPMTDMETAQSRRIAELEKSLLSSQKLLLQKQAELEKSRLETRLYKTMVEMAEEEYSIRIRKNSGPK